MKIAMMVRGCIPAPRPVDVVYTPIDVALAIADGLAGKGHTVDFYGPSGSCPNVSTKTRGLRPLIRNQNELRSLTESADLLTHYIPGLWDHYLAIEMFRHARKGKYDLLHFHHPESALSLAGLFPKIPVVYTLHDSLRGWHPEIFKLFKTPNQYCISVSNNQREDAPDLPYAETVYNGLNPQEWPFSAEHDGYLLFEGRITPEKGIKEAVTVARQSGERLLIVGPLQSSANKKYFDTHVKPYLGEKIVYLGCKPHAEVKKYFQRAKALLMPLQWEEPFGITMIEAMACGTPVIALRRGSASEVVRDGITGFVVDTVEQMTRAVKRLPGIDRAACRQHVVANFSLEKTVNGYESAFKLVLKEARFAPAVRLKKVISKNLYNTVHGQQQILSFPGRAGGVPDLPAQL